MTFGRKEINMKKVIIAAFLGGLVVFAWGAICHMLLPVGQMGLQSLPNEEILRSSLKQSIPEPGMYFFPGMDMSHALTPEEEKVWTAKYEEGPIGLLIINPIGESPMPPSLFINEIVANMLAAVVAAYLLTFISRGSLFRGIVVGLLGIFGWFSFSISYWNWYDFPFSFILGELIDQAIGWFLAGLVMAWLVKPRSK